jgi:hypothetical protein
MDSTGWPVGEILLAQGVKLQFIWYTLGIVGALLAGAFVIALVERWRKKSGMEGLSAGDQLTHFRKLYDQGAISQEEFERIRSQLVPDLRKEMNVPPQPQASPAPAPTPPSTDIMTLPRPPEDRPPGGSEGVPGS